MRPGKSMERRDTRSEQAAEWLVKLEALGEVQLTPEELQAWDVWATDDRNRAAFDELALIRQQIKSIPPLSWPTAMELHADHASDILPLAESTEPDAAAVQASTHARRFGRAAIATMGVAASLLLAIGGWFLYDSPTAGQMEKTYTTTAGERRDIELPDGSTITLGGASQLSAHYTTLERLLVLDRGEALFEVARNAMRPFRVRAGNGTITALGTRFNVRHANERIVVTVAEGLVEVAPIVPVQEASVRTALLIEARWVPMRVEPDQEVSYGTEGKASAVERTDAKIATAWSQGTLVYRRKSLAEVIGDVERYWPRRIILGPGVGELLYSGTVGERNIPAWVQGLPEIFPVDIREQDKNQIVIQLREP